MRDLIKRYRLAAVMLLGLVMIFIWDRLHAVKALGVLGFSLREMVLVIPPIFILLGFLDVWISKETMVKFMGPGSGMAGAFLAVFVGSAAAGPLYGAFPVAAVFLRKGVSLVNILIFIGAWSTTKIPMFLFEMAALGIKFALTRLAVDIPGIIMIAWVLSKLISKNEEEELRSAAQHL